MDGMEVAVVRMHIMEEAPQIFESVERILPVESLWREEAEEPVLLLVLSLGEMPGLTVMLGAEEVVLCWYLILGEEAPILGVDMPSHK
jgi:hypothetical protein